MCDLVPLSMTNNTKMQIIKNIFLNERHSAFLRLYLVDSNYARIILGQPKALVTVDIIVDHLQLPSPFLGKMQTLVAVCVAGIRVLSTDLAFF